MIKFDNYLIRLLRKEDLDAYFHMVQKNRKRLEDFFRGTTSKTRTYADAQLFLNEMLERLSQRTYFPHVIIDINTNRMIGFLDVKNIDWDIPKAEIGAYIDKDYEGKGITGNAGKIFCTHCFHEYGFKKLFLRTHVSNIGARSVAEKCGFQIEGTLRKEYKTSSGEIVDLMYYGKLSD